MAARVPAGATSTATVGRTDGIVVAVGENAQGRRADIGTHQHQASGWHLSDNLPVVGLCHRHRLCYATADKPALSVGPTSPAPASTPQPLPLAHSAPGALSPDLLLPPQANDTWSGGIPLAAPGVLLSACWARRPLPCNPGGRVGTIHTATAVSFGVLPPLRGLRLLAMAPGMVHASVAWKLAFELVIGSWLRMWGSLMGSRESSSRFLFCSLLLLCTLYHTSAFELETNLTASLSIDASPQSGRKIPETLFGIFFEEINHAGAGGLWAELVSNRGFEAGGSHTPSNIDPWSIIGNESFIMVSTDSSSCFERNKIALRMEVACDKEGSHICPYDGVGIYNPGYWGMNIEQGKAYKVILHVRSSGSVNISVSLTSSDGLQNLATSNILAEASDVSNWKKVELTLTSKGTNRNSRLQLTTTSKGVIWFDQVSVMPFDTYKGHGFRKDLFQMLADLKPQFIRFPGGCFVEGEWLRNAFRWRESIGPWEERPGHFGDVWMYWTDDGLGYLEFLQLAEDLGAAPVWVINNGISHNDQVDTTAVLPFVKDALDSIEFARGAPNSQWGSVRAAMGHPEPFDLKYIAIGNEDCWKKNYLGNYRKFYSAIKAAYPDIQIISNCDGSSHQLDHPADMYDFHIYTSAYNIFSMAHQFDHAPRAGPKAFVSEYAVTGKDAGTGSLLAALGEAGFLIGLETNSDVIEMASYAPLFVNVNDRRWNPDAIVFNSGQSFGTPSYWMQQFFRESSGATVFPVKIQSNSSNSLIASAVKWQSSDTKYLRIKVVNFGSDFVNLQISVNGLQNSINSFGSTKTILTSSNVMDENTFSEPNKVTPQQATLQGAGTEMGIVVPGHSINSYDLALSPLSSSL